MWTSADSNAQRFTDILERHVRKDARWIAHCMGTCGKDFAWRELDKIVEKATAEWRRTDDDESTEAI